MSRLERFWMLRGVASALGVRIGTLGLGFIAIVLLGHLLGAEDYGRYSVGMALFATCAPIAGLGLSAIVTREIAAASGTEAAETQAAFARFLLRTSLASGVLAGLALVLAVILLVEAGWLDANIRPAAYAVAALLPLGTLVGALGALQNGLGHILNALAPGQLIQPLVLCLLASTLLLLVGGEAATGAEGLALQVVAALVALFFAAVHFARRMSPRAILCSRDSAMPRPARSYLAGGLMLVVTGLVAALQSQADILLLGALVGPFATGPYHAASRSALLLLTLYNAAWVTLAPLAARKLRSDDRAGLQRDVNLFLVLSVLPMLPVAAVFLARPEIVLQLFGAGFTSATLPLQILTVAALFQLASGPAYLLLVSAGGEALLLRGALLAVTVNLVLNLALIPLLGMTGAALATSAAAISHKVYLVVHAERLTGVRSTIFAWLDRRWSKAEAAAAVIGSGST